MNDQGFARHAETTNFTASTSLGAGSRDLRIQLTEEAGNYLHNMLGFDIANAKTREGRCLLYKAEVDLLTRRIHLTPATGVHTRKLYWDNNKRVWTLLFSPTVLPTRDMEPWAHVSTVVSIKKDGSFSVAHRGFVKAPDPDLDCVRGGGAQLELHRLPTPQAAPEPTIVTEIAVKDSVTVNVVFEIEGGNRFTGSVPQSVAERALWAALAVLTESR